MKKQIPTFESDKAAQDFVDTANLADYDLSGGTPVQFEFEPKSAHINMRVPQALSVGFAQPEICRHLSPSYPKDAQGPVGFFYQPLSA